MTIDQFLKKSVNKYIAVCMIENQYYVFVVTVSSLFSILTSMRGNYTRVSNKKFVLPDLLISV